MLPRSLRAWHEVVHCFTSRKPFQRVTAVKSSDGAQPHYLTLKQISVTRALKEPLAQKIMVGTPAFPSRVGDMRLAGRCSGNIQNKGCATLKQNLSGNPFTKMKFGWIPKPADLQAL